MSVQSHTSSRSSFYLPSTGEISGHIIGKDLSSQKKLEKGNVRLDIKKEKEILGFLINGAN